MIKRILLVTLPLILFSCGNTEKQSKQVAQEPSEIIRKSIPTNDFSLVLDDMSINEENNVLDHRHKYKVLELKGDSLHTTTKGWQSVNKTFFQKHQNDLGMEIISRHNGKTSFTAQPVGFGWAIGNEKHGEWEETSKDSTKTNSSNSHRRWRTHSTSPFFWYWLGTRRSVYRNDYNSYRTYNSSGQSYYGRNASNNSYAYGTRSDYQKKTRPSFFSRKTQNSSRWNNLNKKTSRSSSRYSSGSSTRSRSGGIGK
ncbi:hypothetical protein [Pontimicrobium sp. MEBiC06410]